MLGVSLATLERWLKKRSEGEDLENPELLRVASGASSRSHGSGVPFGSSSKRRRSASTSSGRFAPRSRMGRHRGDGQPISVHENRRARELIEERGCQERGCRLWFLPAYSPDLNPIEEAFSTFSKAKAIPKKAKARTPEALFEAPDQALGSLSPTQTPAAWVSAAKPAKWTRSSVKPPSGRSRRGRAREAKTRPPYTTSAWPVQT